MKLCELKQGDKFKIVPVFELSTIYVKMGEVPGTAGTKFYVDNPNISTVYMADWDMEVIKVGNINL